MAETDKSHGTVTHGARRLPSVVVDSYNVELKDDEGFLGDRASRQAFHAILENWRKPLRKLGADPFGETHSDDLSRPKLDGLWVRLRFIDGDTLEGVVPNDLLGLLDNGVHITPPDLSSSTDRIFVPRPALSELTVLGVVGVARRKPAAAATAQPRLFTD